jgi:hypothetical protein
MLRETGRRLAVLSRLEVDELGWTQRGVGGLEGGSYGFESYGPEWEPDNYEEFHSRYLAAGYRFAVGAVLDAGTLTLIGEVQGRSRAGKRPLISSRVHVGQILMPSAELEILRLAEELAEDASHRRTNRV